MILILISSNVICFTILFASFNLFIWTYVIPILLNLLIKTTPFLFCLVAILETKEGRVSPSNIQIWISIIPISNIIHIIFPKNTCNNNEFNWIECWFGVFLMVRMYDGAGPIIYLYFFFFSRSNFKLNPPIYKYLCKPHFGRSQIAID